MGYYTDPDFLKNQAKEIEELGGLFVIIERNKRIAELKLTPEEHSMLIEISDDYMRKYKKAPSFELLVKWKNKFRRSRI